jgi:DNA topoisomerase-1
VRALGAHPEGGEVAIFAGRYGPYVKWDKVNATLPKGETPETLTLEAALALIAAKAPAKKTATRKAPAAKAQAGGAASAGDEKKAAAKKATSKKPAKKAPARKAAAGTTAGPVAPALIEAEDDADSEA